MAKPTKPISLNDMAQFGSSFGQSAPGRFEVGTPVETQAPQASEPSLVEGKSASLQEISAQKRASLESPEGRASMALASQEGNELAQDEVTKDLNSLSSLAFSIKYGQEAANYKADYARAYLNEDRIQDAGRTRGELLGDTAADLSTGAVNVAGSFLSGVAAIGDYGRNKTVDAFELPEVFGYPLAPGIGKATQAITGQINSLKSDTSVERGDQFARAAQLDKIDREAQYQQDLAANADSDSKWDRVVSPWLKKQGAAMVDTAVNYAQNPDQAASLVTQGVASVAAFAAPISYVGKARAVSKMVAGGMSKEAAKASLKTASGRSLALKEGEKAAPLIMGLGESGAAVQQNQMKFLSLTEADMVGNDKYWEMRNNNMSHDEVLGDLVIDSGFVTFALALPAAILAGKLTASFAANPLGRGVGSTSIAQASKKVAGNTARETTEEFIQEGNAQLTSNAGLIVGGGVETELFEDVASSAVEGAIGGLGAAGIMQSPGLAGKVVSTVASAGSDVAGSALEARTAAAEASANADSAVSPDALKTANESMADAASTIGAPAPDTEAPEASETPEVSGPPTPNQTGTEEPTDPTSTDEPTESTEPTEPVNVEDVSKAADKKKAAQDVVRNSALLSDVEAMETMDQVPALKESFEANPRPLTRIDVIDAHGATLANKESTDDDRLMASFGVLSEMAIMREASATDVETEMNKLDEADPDRVKYTTVNQSVKLYESSAAVTEANKFIGSMDPVKLREVVGLDDPAGAPKTEEEALNRGRLIDMIKLANPEAVTSADINIVLDQVGGGKTAERLKKKLKVASLIAKSFETSDANKEQNQADLDAALKDMTPEQRKKEQNVSDNFPTFKLVSNQIRNTGDEARGLISLSAHNARIRKSMDSGHKLEGQAALIELKAFATSQINKMKAINKSVSEGAGRSVPYMSYKNGDRYMDKKGIYGQVKSPASVAMMRNASADLEAVVGLFNILLDQYGPEMGTLTKDLQSGALKAPDLNSRALKAPAVVETKPKAKPKKKVKSEPVIVDEVIDDESVAEPVVDEDADLIDNDNVGAVATVEDVAPVEPEPTDKPSTEAELKTKALERHWMTKSKDRLLAAKGSVNHFIQAFNAKPLSSLMAEQEDPIAFLMENITKLQRDDNGMIRELTKEEVTAVTALVQNEMPKFAKSIDDLTNERLTAEDDRWIKSLMNGTNAKGDKTQDILSTDDGKTLNFMTLQENGKYAIDPLVSQALFMATSEWMARTARRSIPSYDVDELKKKFGTPDNAVITDSAKLAASQGMPLQGVLDEIARLTQDLLGVSADKTVTASYTSGLFKALAGTALQAQFLEGQIEDFEGVVLAPKTDDAIEAEKTALKAKGKPTDQIKDAIEIKWTFINPKPTGSNATALKTLGSMPDVFTRAFTQDGEKERHIGKPSTKRESHQLRNPIAKLSEDETTVLDMKRNTSSYVNTSQVWLMDTLGRDMYGKALGLIDLDNISYKLNPAHRTSIEGKNASIRSGIEGVDGYLSEIDAYAEATGTTRYKVPTYFDWVITSVGRLMQQGPVTQQGNKTMREMITPTVATIDLSDSEMVDRVWLAVAQAADIKVHKQDPELSIQQAKDLFNDPEALLPALDIVDEWRRGEIDGDRMNFMRSDFVKAVTASNVEVTDKLLHAIQTVQAMKMAQEQGGEAKTSFKVSLGLEADGITDGPINAIMHMSVGEFTIDDIRRYAQGGLMFSPDKKTFADHFTEDPDDLYEVAAKKLRDLILPLLDDPAYAALLKVMDKFLDGFSYNPVYGPTVDGSDHLTIKRGVTKNPLTVFLYGAGEEGIAGKIASLIIDEIHVGLSLEANKSDRSPFDPETVKALKELFGSGIDDMDISKIISNPAGNKMMVDHIMHRGVTLKIQELLIPHLRESLDFATGGLAIRMEQSQTLASIQTAIFQDLFEKQYNAVLKEWRTEGKIGASQTLPEAELKTIFESLLKSSPVYDTDAQSFHISPPKATLQEGNESQGVSKTPKLDRYNNNTKVSRLRRFGSQNTVKTPSDASVKVSPYLTIGTGDGRMILNTYVQGDSSITTTLPVYDGVVMSLDNIVTNSEQINKANFDAWMLDGPYEAMATGYQQMLATLKKSDIANFSLETRKKINRAFGRKPWESMSNEALFDALVAQQRLMADLAMESKARKLTIAEVSTSTDHLAAAGSPYVREGTDISNGKTWDYEGIKNWANKIHRKHMKTLRRAEKKQLTSRDAAQKDPQLVAAIKAVGTEVENHEKVTMLTGGQIPLALKDIDGLSVEQKSLLQDVLMKDPKFVNATYYFGSPKQLEAVRNDLHSELDKSPIQRGQAHIGSNIVFVSNLAPETLLHEMLHVHTTRILVNHFDDPRSSAPNVTMATRNLEALIKEFRSLIPERFTGTTTRRKPGERILVKDFTGTAGSIAVLQKELTTHEANPARQMNEFVSWMMTNQNLIEMAKKRKVYDPVLKIAQKVLGEVKRMLKIKSKPGSTLFSNISFNTEMLLGQATKDQQIEMEQFGNYMMNQVNPTNPRLEQLDETYTNRLEAHIRLNRERFTAQATPGDESVADRFAYKIDKLIQVSAEASTQATHAGFLPEVRQEQVFRQIHKAMMSGMRMEAGAVERTNRIFGHVMKTLKPSDLLAPGSSETNKKAMKAAERRYDMLTGADGLRRTANGNTDVLATFLALSQTDPILRNAMENMASPKNNEIKKDTVDGWINRVMATIANMITSLSVSRKAQPRNVKGALDVLAEALAVQKRENQYIVMAENYARMDKINDWSSNMLSLGSEKTSQWIDKQNKKINPTNRREKAKKAALVLSSFVVSMGSKSEAEIKGNSLTNFMNGFENLATTREIIRDFRGRTPSNAPVFDLLNPINTQVDSVRQDARVNIPKELTGYFSKKLSEKENDDLFTVIAKADLMALSRNEALFLMADPVKSGSMVQAAEEKVSSLGGNHSQLMRRKARALAKYMVNRDNTSQSLLRNARAISELLNEDVQNKPKPNKKLENALDRLVTLYAFDLMEDSVKQTVKDLSATEKRGMEVLAGYHKSNRALEAQRLPKGEEGLMLQYNGWKGYAPSTPKPGTILEIADDSKHQEMIFKGFVKVSAYKGDPTEKYQGTRSLYRSTVGGKASFNQGLAQTVHPTWRGVDQRTGVTRSAESGGPVPLEYTKQIKLRGRTTKDGVPAGEYLQPVFNGKGEVKGYERTLKAEDQASLQSSTDLFKMSGVWTGRILEEEISGELNQQVLLATKKIHDDHLAKYGNIDDFVNVADKDQKDATIKDAYGTLGWQIKEAAAKLYGKPNYLPLRKDVVLDVIGTRSASITDSWSGVSRWRPKTQKAFKDMATTIIGADAFKYFSTVEGTIQDAVSLAKDTIVVKSVIVIIDNLFSNQLHLGSWGIGYITGSKAMVRKFIETSAYNKNKEQITALNVELQAEIQNKRKANQIKGQIQALEDANRQLSIWPLLEAGEYTLKSEDVNTGDKAMSENRVTEFLSNQFDKLPEVVKTTAKHLVISQDTALFKGLNRMVQYGDFLAKAVLYDHLTQQKGMTSKEALAVIVEEFVPYSRLSGRGRGAAEANGLVWFSTYKIRIMKIGANMIRNRPTAALLFGAGIGPALNVDTVFSGSGLGKYMQGTLGYSFGWGMGLQAPSMLPVNAILPN